MRDLKIRRVDQRDWTELLHERPIRGLNVGCGSGFYHLYPASELFLHTDLSTLTDGDGGQSVPGSAVLVNDRLLYLQQDATVHFPLADASFDWIFCEHLIEHLQPTGALSMLREFQRLLRPGGVIRISTPDLGLFAAGYMDESGEFFARYAERLADAAVNSRSLADHFDSHLTRAQMDEQESFWRDLDPDFALSDNTRRALLERVAQTLRTRFKQPAVMMNQICRLYGHR